jgi:enoyl-CoA hydratase/carnithine racemase
MSSSIQLEKREGIAIISLTRPEALNALNYEALSQLSDLIEQVRHDRAVRCVIVRGEGKAFCVGADLKERLHLTEAEVRRNVHKIGSVFKQLATLPQPTMAAIHGYAFGGGFELALACDFRYASKETKMGLTEVSLGIIPGAGGTIRLTELVGKSKAKELILMAKRVSAEEALQLGMVNEICEEDVLEFALSRADIIAQLAPLAVIQAKFAIDKGYDTDSQTGMDIEAKAYELLIPTEDRIEALKAFTEKRKPNFKGK